MKKALLFLLIIGNLFLSARVSAADLIQVFQQAMVSDPVYQQAISQRLSDKQGMPINIAALLPQFNITAVPTLQKTTQSGILQANGISSSNTQRGYNLALNLTQVLFDFGKFALVGQAYALSKEADATLNSATQNLMLRVSQAYFNVLQDEDNLRYISATKKAFKQQLDQTNQQYKVGVKTITDVYTARASYESSVADYIGAENQLANDRENLRAITGVYYSNLSKLSESFPLISPLPNNSETWVRTAILQNWDIKVQQYAAQASLQSIKQQFAGNLPNANIQGIYNFNYMNQVSGGSLLNPQGANRINTRIVNLNFNIPVFSGGAVTAETRKAQYDYQVATQRLEKQFRDTINLTRQSFLGVITGISKINADKDAIKSNISSLKGMQEGYRVGTEILVNVLNQQKFLVQAQKQYATDRYAYVNSLLTLKQAAGTLSIEDLQAINAWLRGC